MSDRFPPSPQALEICKDVVLPWVDEHCPGKKVEDQITMMASRVNSWVSGSSVVAGVRDIMASHLPPSPEMAASIEELGNRLGKRLSEAGLLIASPRRGGGLSQ